VNGYDLFYRERGRENDRTPVILAHGGPGHSSLSFKDGMDFLAANRRVIFYDQRGSGNSQIKPARQDYTIEQLVEELETVRRDVVRCERVILLGHSFGSALVQRYALKYPEHVAKMIIVGGIRINNGMGNRLVWERFGGALYATSLGFPPADARAADAWFTHSAEKDNIHRLFDKSKLPLLQDTGLLSFAPWHEISLSLAGPDYREALRQLAIPTLFAFGVADSPFTGKPVADELCQLLPNCQAVAFEQSGHWPFLEQPERFQTVVNAFLATGQ
jgi:proline iminopeptidase